MDTTEAEHGLTLTLHSNANKDIYKENSPCGFTNLLKIPVKLDPNEKYEACLANIHTPTTQALLLKRSDHDRNDIRFHIGMFLFDDVKSDWKLLDGSKIDLWSYSLNKNVSGLEFGNGVARVDFIKRFRDSFNLSSTVNFKNQKCLAVFDIFLRHKYGNGHDGVATTVSECRKCIELMASDGSTSGRGIREGINIGHGLPYIDFFEDYNLDKKDQIYFKNLEDLNSEEKYYIFNQILYIYGVDKYAYIREVIYNNLPHTNKAGIGRLVNKIRDKVTNKKFAKFQQIFRHDIYAKLWFQKKVTPQFALFASFGDKMSKYLSIGKEQKMVLLTCGNEKTFNIFDYNPILMPRFFNPRIDSLYIYSDLISKTVRVGDYITNLLGIVTINNKIYNRPNPQIIYRPLAHNFIQSVSVKIADENGDIVNYTPDSYVALEIIIRKR